MVGVELLKGLASDVWEWDVRCWDNRGFVLVGDD